MKMPKDLKDRTTEIRVDWGETLEYGEAHSGHGITLRMKPGDDPEKLRNKAQAYVSGLVQEDLKG